jgi:hypothetical protein
MSKNDRRWLAFVAVSLVVASAIIYSIHYAIFRSGHDVWSYLLLDLAFIPVTVLIVGLIIERVLAFREKRNLIHKMNMVIGAFFSETGTELLAGLLPAMEAGPEIMKRLALTAHWGKPEFAAAQVYARTLESKVDLSRIDLDRLKAQLLEDRQFVLRLLENSNLLEHDRFTDLLWAVSHLQEEFAARPVLRSLPRTDEAHLEGDVRRVYIALAGRWLEYVAHLKSDYPYLYSLVLRTHPFQETRSATVVE